MLLFLDLSFKTREENAPEPTVETDKSLNAVSNTFFSLTERWASYEVIRQLECLNLTVNQATFSEACRLFPQGQWKGITFK